MSIINFKKFVSTDNISEKEEVTNRLIQEAIARLLLQNNLIKGLFKDVTVENDTVILPLAESLNVIHNSKPHRDWQFNFLQLMPSIFVDKDKFDQNGQIRLYHNPRCHYGNDYIRDFILNSGLISKKNPYTDILDIVLEFGVYSDNSEILDIYGVSHNIYESIKRTHLKLKEDIKFSLLKYDECTHHASQVHYLMGKLVCGDYTIEPLDEYEKLYDNKLQLLFPFRKLNGHTTMKVAKVYGFGKGATKHYFPITQWYSSSKPQRFYYAIPKQGLQPIINQDYIAKLETPDVIICDNIELAYLNQQCANENVVFTAWLCSDIERVDFTPLAHAKSISFLINNHSGKSLEEQYVATSLLAEQLKELAAFKDKKFSYIQLACEYPKLEYIHNFSELESSSLKGKVISESYAEMSVEQFEEMLQKATARLEPVPKLWESSPITETKSSIGELKLTEGLEFLINPILIKGQQTSLYGAKNSGKSMLAYNIATLLTAIGSKRGFSLFKEVAWNRSSIENYPCRKVLYLDFENGADAMDERIKLLGDIYWKKDSEKSRNNLIAIDMQEEKYRGKDYSKVENHQIIFDLIAEAKNTGINNQPVDIVIIDTYNKFCKKETIGTNENFTELSSALRRMNIAVFVVGQLSSDNSKPRGFSQKNDDDYATLVTSREDQSKSYSIADMPLTLKLKHYRGKKNELMEQDLLIKFDETKGFKLYNPEEHNESEHIRNYADCIYKSYERIEVAKRLGMSESTLYEKLKK